MNRKHRFIISLKFSLSPSMRSSGYFLKLLLPHRVGFWTGWNNKEGKYTRIFIWTGCSRWSLVICSQHRPQYARIMKQQIYIYFSFPRIHLWEQYGINLSWDQVKVQFVTSIINGRQLPYRSMHLRCYVILSIRIMDNILISRACTCVLCLMGILERWKLTRLRHLSGILRWRSVSLNRWWLRDSRARSTTSENNTTMMTIRGITFTRRLSFSAICTCLQMQLCHLSFLLSCCLPLVFSCTSLPTSREPYTSHFSRVPLDPKMKRDGACVTGAKSSSTSSTMSDSVLSQSSAISYSQ